MRDFNWYCDRAKAQAGVATDRALADLIGIQPPTVSQMRAGKSPPSPATMHRLAELAGVPDDQAALDLARWQAERDPAAAWMVASLERLFRHAAGSAAVLLLLLLIGTGDAKANITSTGKQVYSFNYTLCDKRMWRRVAKWLARLRSWSAPATVCC